MSIENLEHKLNEAEACMESARLFLSEILSKDFTTKELEDVGSSYNDDYYIDGVKDNDIVYRCMSYTRSRSTITIEMEYAPLDDMLQLAGVYIDTLKEKI